MTSPGTILLAGLLSGCLDLAATSTLVRSQGVSLEHLLQRIAGGALGPSSFQGGKRAAAIGLLFHFLIAFTAASLYYIATRYESALNHHWLLSGILFGIAVHLVMSRIVVPLSAVPKRPFSTKAFFIQLLFVGLPISFVVSRLSS
jgi:hypothetical protein